MRRCRRICRLLSSYVYGELQADEMALIERHLEECKRCEEELTAINRTLEAVPRETIDPVPEEEWGRVMSSLEERIKRLPQKGRPWSVLLRLRESLSSPIPSYRVAIYVAILMIAVIVTSKMDMTRLSLTAWREKEAPPLHLTGSPEKTTMEVKFPSEEKLILAQIPEPSQEEVESKQPEAVVSIEGEEDLTRQMTAEAPPEEPKETEEVLVAAAAETSPEETRFKIPVLVNYSKNPKSTRFDLLWWILNYRDSAENSVGHKRFSFLFNLFDYKRVGDRKTLNLLYLFRFQTADRKTTT